MKMHSKSSYKTYIINYDCHLCSVTEFGLDRQLCFHVHMDLDLLLSASALSSSVMAHFCSFPLPSMV